MNKQISTVTKPIFFRRVFTMRNMLIMVMIIFIILALFAKRYPHFPIDLVITKTIQQFHPLWFDSLMRFLTTMGDSTFGPLMVTTAALLLFIKHEKKAALLLLLSSIGIVIIGWIVKFTVARPRPDALLIQQYEHFIRPNSFPSGHVLLYLGLFGFLQIIVYTKLKQSPARSLLLFFLWLLILLIGLSRIYVGAHWFSDVLGSYLIGFVWLYGMVHIYRKINL